MYRMGKQTVSNGSVTFPSHNVDRRIAASSLPRYGRSICSASGQRIRCRPARSVAAAGGDMSRVKTLGTTTALAIALVGALTAIAVVRGAEDLRINDPVPAANPSTAALVQPDLVAGGFELRQVVQGTDPLENPSGVITQFGLLNNAAKTKTEPDQSTY